MNTLRVKLTNAKGISVAGAEITVKFFMAAMPEMGMAAMSTSAKLIQKSDALYEGQGNLGSGGGWRVTITVQRKGQTVVTKEMHVNAEGGM
jgi:Cu(I)/Ag(I) efflux system membrane fusion protein/cobalt-zinc-cadmium efflux system membrane fusion protein